MNKIFPSSAKSLLFIIGGVFLFFATPLAPHQPTLATADTTYKNCSIDLVSSFTGDDWRTAYFLKGNDGNVWQRAIMRNPEGTIVLKEGESVDLSGTASFNSKISFFVYSANEDYETAGLNPPGEEGSCFDAGIAATDGVFTITLSSRTLWGVAGENLIVDAYYQTEEGFEQDTGQETNEDFFIGTGNLLQPLAVEIEAEPFVPGECPEYCPDPSPLGQEVQLLDVSEIETIAKRYMPEGAANTYVTDNFGSITRRVAVLKNAPSNHTFSLGLEASESTYASQAVLLSLQQKVVAMEQIKRLFFGELTGVGMQEPLTAEDLKKAADGTDFTDLQPLAIAVRGAITLPDPDRDTAIGNIKMAFDKMIKRSRYLREWPPYQIPPKKIFDEVFLTEIKNSDDWAKAYLDLIDFWTRTRHTNSCLVADDGSYDENYSNSDGYIGNGLYDFCEFKVSYTNGISPRLIIESDDPIALTPDFSNVIMTSADKKFNAKETWNFTSDQEKVLRYAYDDQGIPLGNTQVASACIEKKDVPKLTNKISVILGLNESESRELSGEINTAFKNTSGKSLLTFIDPNEVSSRISWENEGKPLHIYQLFFIETPNGCDTFSIPDSLPLSSEKYDGFEFGKIRK